MCYGMYVLRHSAQPQPAECARTWLVANDDRVEARLRVFAKATKETRQCGVLTITTTDDGIETKDEEAEVDLQRDVVGRDRASETGTSVVVVGTATDSNEAKSRSHSSIDHIYSNDIYRQ